jgi:hypothetical protein
MPGLRRYAALSCLVAAAALIGLLSDSSPGAAGTHAEPSTEMDVEFAFDTTGSMGPSIEQAKRDARSFVEQTREAFPDARFAVVSFRDHGNPGGVYEVLQPMTGDITAVQAAFSRLRLSSNPSPQNTPAEEYNLVLERSYTDGAIAWRPQARRVVVVVGDAQPHGAGTSGIAGCTDSSVDPYGLTTASVLEGMRAAQRTLVMLRQVSPRTTVSLPCYAAMAERAYAGGAARDGGAGDLAGPIVELIQSAVAPVTMRPDLGLALPGGTAGYTATVSNPNRFALRLRSVDVTLPVGFRYRSGSPLAAASAGSAAPATVSLRIERLLGPSETASVHFRVRAPKRRGRYSAQAVARLQLPGGHSIASTSAASLRVTPRIRSLLVTTAARKPLRSSSTISLGGSLWIAFRPGARTSGGTLRARRLTLRRGPAELTLRARSYRIVSIGSPTVLRLGLEVERVRGLPGCLRRTSGSALIADDQRVLASGLRGDTVVARFDGGCRIASGRWSNRGAARSTVTATAR